MSHLQPTLSRLYSEDYNKPFAQVHLNYDQGGLPIRLPRELKYKKIKPKVAPLRNSYPLHNNDDNNNNFNFGKPDERWADANEMEGS